MSALSEIGRFRPPPQGLSPDPPAAAALDLDELGSGGIRDAFTDYFFPGTSTLHTRVKYFLLVPWVQQSRKVYHPDPQQYSTRLEAAERALITALKQHNPGETGIIGSRSAAVQTLSYGSVYLRGSCTGF